MKKPFNTLSKSAFAAIIAASALTPVAAQAAEANNTLESVVVTTADGQLASLSYAEFLNAFDAEIISNKDIKYVVGTGNKTYSIEDFLNAFDAEDTIEKALVSLDKNNHEVSDVKILEGEIKDGKVVAKDETLEEKVNETFFYNLAA